MGDNIRDEIRICLRDLSSLCLLGEIVFVHHTVLTDRSYKNESFILFSMSVGFLLLGTVNYSWGLLKKKEDICGMVYSICSFSFE